MSKPLVLRKAGNKWEVFVNVAAAKAYAPRRVHAKIDQRWPQGGLVSVSRTGSGSLDFGGTPAKFSKGDAEHVAHKIGRYMLDLGDLAYTYTEEQRGGGSDPRRRPRRDPATGTHRGNADLIRWYLRYAREVHLPGAFHGPGGAERGRKARAAVSRNVQALRRMNRSKALDFVRSFGYRG